MSVVIPRVRSEAGADPSGEVGRLMRAPVDATLVFAALGILSVALLGAWSDSASTGAAAKERLEPRPDGLVRIALKCVDADGIVVDKGPLSLLCRRALRPPTRPHQHLGVHRRALRRFG